MTLPAARLIGAAAIGGAVGGLLRYTAGSAFPDDGGFALTTFAINVSGCFVLAWLLPVLAARQTSRWLQVALGPGVLGGFTTMSAYAEQSRALLADGELWVGFSYVVATLLACVLAVAVGQRLGARG